MQNTADILFEYLKNILYDPEKAELEVDTLPEEYRKLGEGMHFLAKCVLEARTFATSMARGDLSQQPPSVENMLAAPIKELQSSLRHLAWQTQEVAKGDYSQTVDFMGEFSKAFNTMTRQLKERQEALDAEKKIIEDKNVELEQNLELVLTLTKFTHTMFFVYSVEGEELLFSNEAAQWLEKTRPQIAESVRTIICNKDPEVLKASPIWEIEVPGEAGNGDVEYFGVESYYFTWKGQQAMVHILMDDTERKKKGNLMYKLAYVDPLTGLNNRRYAMNQMETLMKENTDFVMTFIDIDYLKYCNDTFGHKAGDEYLTDVANALKSLGGEVCRIGGDEFIMIQTGLTAHIQDERLEELRSVLRKSSGQKKHPVSFSFASCDVSGKTKKELEEYIKLTDMKMYQYKVRNKKALIDAIYEDDRI